MNISNSWNTIVKRHPFLTGLLIRLLIATTFPIILDENNVKYTDVDYNVFSDAAELVTQGKSPYERHTYRYTPLLAMILSILGPQHIWWFGRYLFCIVDAICGHLIHILRREQQQQQHCNYDVCRNDDDANVFLDSLWWLYNPLAINICTRGSAESLIVLGPVLSSIYVATTTTKYLKNVAVRCVITGVLHGLSVHMKIYPIIYTASFMAYFSRISISEQDWNHHKINYKAKKNRSIVISFLTIWMKRLLRPIPLLFLSCSMLTFFGLTLLSVYLYGYTALYESLLYHLFYRMDHRHNYSIHWYWIYLLLEKESIGNIGTAAIWAIHILKLLLVLPQCVILLLLSLGLAPYDLQTTLFFQTYLFVCWNKVCTGQYLTWFLCLLPLCHEKILAHYNRYLGVGLSILFWLCMAYLLEIRGNAFHLGVWMGSLLFFVANISLMCGMLQNYLLFCNTVNDDERIVKKKIR